MVLLLLLVLASADPRVQDEREIRQFVFEGDPRQFTRTAERIELRQGSGRLRVPSVYLDFDLQMEYRVTPESQAALAVRSWPSDRSDRERIYSLTLPTRAENDVERLMKTDGVKARLLRKGSVVLNDGQAWQRLRVTGDGSQITVRVNDTEAAVYDVEDFGGSFFLTCRKGTLEIGRIVIADRSAVAVAPTVPDTPSPTASPAAPPMRSPEIRREVKPIYTREAMQERVEGDVEVDALVRTDGTVGPVVVVKPLHRDLDRSAIAAVKAWRFKPGERGGTPVPVIVRIVLTFTMRAPR